MHAQWLEAIDKLCPFVFTTFRRSSAWRTRKSSPRPRSWALPPRELPPVRSIKSPPNISKNRLRKEHPGSPRARRRRRPAAAPAPPPPAGTHRRRSPRHRRPRPKPSRNRRAATADPSLRKPAAETNAESTNPTPPNRRRQSPSRHRAGSAAAARRPTPPPPPPTSATARAESRREGWIHSAADQDRRRKPAKSGTAKLPPDRPAGQSPVGPSSTRRGDVRGNRGAPQSVRARRPARRSRDRKLRRRSPTPAAKIALPADAQVITIKPPIVVRELAEQLKQKPFKIIADLMEAGRLRQRQPGD